MTSVLTLLGVGIGSTACAVALTLAPPLPVHPPDRARTPDGHAQCDPRHPKWWTPPHLHVLKSTAATASLRISSRSSYTTPKGT